MLSALVERVGLHAVETIGKRNVIGGLGVLRQIFYHPSAVHAVSADKIAALFFDFALGIFAVVNVHFVGDTVSAQSAERVAYFCLDCRFKLRGENAQFSDCVTAGKNIAFRKRFAVFVIARDFAADIGIAVTDSDLDEVAEIFERGGGYVT